MLPDKFNNLKDAISFLDEESRIVLLDFDNKKVEVRNLLSGCHKYKKENPDVAKQMRTLANDKIDELESIDSKLDQICKKQEELRKKLMLVFKKEEKKEENKEGTARELSVRKVIKAEKKEIKIEDKIEEKPVLQVKKVKKKSTPKREPEAKSLGSKIPKPKAEKKKEPRVSLAGSSSYHDQASQAAKAQKKLASLSLGKSYGNA